MIARLMIRCSFLILVAILISSAQAFLSALIPRRHYNYCLSTTSAKNDEPGAGDANATARDVVVACMDGLLTRRCRQENQGKIFFYGRNSTYGLQQFSCYIGSTFSMR